MRSVSEWLWALVQSVMWRNSKWRDVIACVTAFNARVGACQMTRFNNRLREFARVFIWRLSLFTRSSFRWSVNKTRATSSGNYAKCSVYFTAARCAERTFKAWTLRELQTFLSGIPGEQSRSVCLLVQSSVLPLRAIALDFCFRAATSFRVNLSDLSRHQPLRCSCSSQKETEKSFIEEVFGVISNHDCNTGLKYPLQRD